MKTTPQKRRPHDKPRNSTFPLNRRGFLKMALQAGAAVAAAPMIVPGLATVPGQPLPVTLVLPGAGEHR